MADYSDGKWHGWNGGECPVHPRSEVDVLNPDDLRDHDCPVGYFDSAGDVDWALPLLFRVTKPYREPREWWAVGLTLHETKERADDFLRRLIRDNPQGGFAEWRVIHVREVLE